MSEQNAASRAAQDHPNNLKTVTYQTCKNGDNIDSNILAMILCFCMSYKQNDAISAHTAHAAIGSPTG